MAPIEHDHNGRKWQIHIVWYKRETVKEETTYEKHQLFTQIAEAVRRGRRGYQSVPFETLPKRQMIDMLMQM